MKEGNQEINIPKVSIIIACYNDLFVEKAVEMAYKQDYKNKEIILVNDGSNKETTSLIERLMEHTDTILSQQNSGQSVARNNGIKQSSGEYILNWDSDDYFEPSFCSRAVELMEGNIDIKIVTCYSRRFNENGTIDIFKPQGGSLENFLFSNSAMGSAMFRKTDWLKCGGYDENREIWGFEDWEFYLRILLNGGYAKVLKDVLFHYRLRTNSTTSQIKHIKAEKFRYIILKHPELYRNHFKELIDHLFKRLEHSDYEKKEKGRFFRLPDREFSTGTFS